MVRGPMRLLLPAVVAGLAAPGSRAAGEPYTHGADTGERVHVQADGTAFTRLSTGASRRAGSIVIDGRANDPAWESAPETAVDWSQRPVEGYGKVSALTYFRVLYDDDAVYVMVRATDSEPDKIVGVLNRGDNFKISMASDWVAVLLDPTLDQRNAFGFQVNPAGVKIDYRVLDDTTKYDLSYNPVWEVATGRDGDGWTAEYRIPYSQLRLHAGYQKQWGLQVYRWLKREGAHYYWSPQPFSTGRHTSLWGRLDVNDELRPRRSIQFAPYTAAGVELHEVSEDDTINDPMRPVGKLGVDLQVALTDSLRFTSAINPDFGQVEADPSEVNLTARETFFSERRPLFTADDELFRFPIGRESERIYYTRRIGAPPRLSQAGAADFVEEDRATTIYNASKITGQIPGGVTTGLLGAITAEETSRGQMPGGEIRSATIEPMTGYGVGQLRKTFRDGDSELRASGTAVHRFLDGTGIENLTRTAYAGGVQYDHRFADKAWALVMQGVGSRVEGDPAAINAVQRASPRYLQRPDADHADYDPERTSLTGYAGKASLSRVGLNWSGAVGVDARSPGFETNDVGFLLDADLIDSWAKLGYVSFSKGLAKHIDVEVAADSFADFGGEILRHRIGAVSSIAFRDESTLATNMAFELNLLDTRLLRGGPALAGSDEASAGIAYTTDRRRAVVLGPSVDYAFRPDSASSRYTAAVSFTANPASHVEVSVVPTFTRNIDDSQFVPPPQTDAAGDIHYILGRIDQRTLFATTRLSYTFTPRIALDLYAQPFVSVGRFSDFKQPDELRSRDDERRFRPVATTQDMGTIAADFDDDGTADASFTSPDFSITRLNTNIVFRWEYLPASFVYAIFSSASRGFAPDGTLSSRDYETVWTADSEKVVLIKLSYWWDR